MLQGREAGIQKGFIFSSQRVLVFMLQEIFSWELLTHHLLRSPLCWKPNPLFWPSFGKKLGIWRILTGSWSTSSFRNLEQEDHKFKGRLCKWVCLFWNKTELWWWLGGLCCPAGIRSWVQFQKPAPAPSPANSYFFSLYVLRQSIITVLHCLAWNLQSNFSLELTDNLLVLPLQHWD